MKSILITGSNRGLGLAWAKLYAELDWRVYATCRHPEQAEALHPLAAMYPNLSVHRLDVTHEDEIASLAKALENQPIDILLNNAGVYFEKYLEQSLEKIDYDHWQETFNVNTLGPMRITSAFADNVSCSDKRLVVAISSHMGSIADIDIPNDYAYRSSKAALNAAMKGLSFELSSRGIGVLMLHPGWVQTRMGGPGAPLTPQESVKGMRQVIEGFKREDSGCFYRYDGITMPW